jgi:hypothetical protein
MPAAKSSPSVQDSPQGSLQSVKAVAVSQVRRIKRIYKTKASPRRAALVTALATGLAVLFPLPFTVAGVIAAVDDALNSEDDREELKAFLQEAVAEVGKQAPKKKKNRGTVGAPAPAAG